jgi:hypothetical protein
VKSGTRFLVRDLSLHILDLVENSIRAGASAVAVTIDADRSRDVLRIVVEDNGPGFPTAASQVVDPFFTTKGKKTGLGLSLFAATAERAGGQMVLGASPLGGAIVAATMALSHVDRPPMGDLAATIASVACTNPQLDLRVTLVGSERFMIGPGELIAKPRIPDSGSEGFDPTAAARIADLVRAGAERAWKGLGI